MTLLLVLARLHMGWLYMGQSNTLKCLCQLQNYKRSIKHLPCFHLIDGTNWSNSCFALNVYTQFVSKSATTWTVASQAPLSIDFSRQEYWSMLPFSTSEDFPDLGIQPVSLVPPALTGGFFTTGPPWWLSWYRICLQCGTPGFDPWVVRSPGEVKSYPLQYSGLENFMHYIVHEVSKSWTWHEKLLLSLHVGSPFVLRGVFN